MSNRKYEKGNLHLNVRIHKMGLRFNGIFPAISRPEPIGVYCINEERKFMDNAVYASYLKLPPLSALPLDLNAGIENVQRKNEDPLYTDIQNFCTYIGKHQDLFRTSSNGSLNLGVDFVTFRGILRQVMCMIYEQERKFRMMAVRVNGTIYLSKVETEEQRKDREQMSVPYMNMCSWGFKFEQYATTRDPNVAPDTSCPVNENTEFVCVYRTNLSRLRLMYAAEMDCMMSNVIVNVNDPKQLRNVDFAELKTTAYNMNSKQMRSFNHYKSHHWWSQSFLVGIGTIIAGLRDREGMLQSIQNFSIHELQNNKPWSSAAMTTFLDNFLNEVKLVMEHVDDSNALVQLDFDPIASAIRYTVLKGPNIQPMLPDWYRRLIQGSSINKHN